MKLVSLFLSVKVFLKILSFIITEMNKNIGFFFFFFFSYCEEQKCNFENNYMNFSSLNTELGLDLSLYSVSGHLQIVKKQDAS